MTGFGSAALMQLFALDRPQVCWRHDVDYDPACAVEMAELEAGCGVKATYYIRLRGPYNPFERETRAILHAISALGHQLALHVDLGLERDSVTPEWLLARAAERDYRILSMEHQLVRRVSFHAPPKSIYGKNVPGFDHAFAPAWVDFTVSDSRGVWHGDPEALLRSRDRACLAIHPEWHFWDAERAEEWRKIEAAKP